MKVVIVHDYLTQRGGAERVVLSMLKAFPEAPLYTSFYDAQSTFPEFRAADVHPLLVNSIGPLRRNHRLALPLLAAAFSRCRVDADVVLCSSSGWAHGARVVGRKVVYCYTPARWLYQTSSYLGSKHTLAGTTLKALHPYLTRWDRRAALSAETYLTSSTAVAARIQKTYGIGAEIVPPPHTLGVAGRIQPLEGLDPGFVLCVSRLLAYKNLDATIEAFRGLPDLRLVVVGTGPEYARLKALSPPNVRLLGSVPDDSLRWLYQCCSGLIAASFEDYGLTPIEAAAFGKPACVLRWGGFLDTVIHGRTGVFFDDLRPESIRVAIEAMASTPFDGQDLLAHAANYSEDRFITHLRRAVLGHELANRVVPE